MEIRRKLMIVIIILIAIVTTFLTLNTKFRTYNRISIPDVSSEIDSHNDYFEYMLEYLSLMLPKYQLTEVQDEDINTTIIHKKELIYSKEFRTTINVAHEIINRKDFYFKYNMNNFDYANVIANTDTSMYVDTFKYSANGELVNAVCGNLAGDEKCLQYVDEKRGVCYTVAINNGFTMSMMGFYCPDAKEFDNKEDQFINYLYDGFMSLEIPEEFSSIYPRSRSKD